MDLNRTIYIGRDDDISEVLRRLLDLADSPREVVMQVGTREVSVSEAVAERFERSAGTAEEPEAEPEAEPEPDPEPTGEAAEETTAPRKRAPRKAATPAAEETA